MHRLTLVLLFAVPTLTVIASREATAEKVTGAQLEQVLTAASGKPDAEVAQRLAALELTERLNALTLAKFKGELSGEKARQALMILADESAFLAQSAADLPAKPAPDAAAQRHMMASVVSYVTKTVHQLPNFSATLDAAQSALTWSHWERGADGLEAVFSYQVPAKKSHYRVQFCCVTDDTIVAAGTQPMNSRVFHELAAYHGEISVDPVTGAIHRVTVEAELAPGEPLTKASIMVEYGAVEIGGKSFICPLRSVALAQKHVFQETLGARPAAAFDRSPLKTFLNDVAFGGFHRLGSEMHILTADIGEPSGNPAASEPEGA